MRAWMMAHVYGAKYQAAVCMCGSGGEAAFRESLRPQYTSPRHDAKGLRTYYITGTSGENNSSRITSNCIGGTVDGTHNAPLQITVASNAFLWQRGDLSENQNLVCLGLEMEMLTHVSPSFLGGCRRLVDINLAPLRRVETIPYGFMYDCCSLSRVDLSPLLNVREVEGAFLMGCSGLTSIDLSPLRVLDKVPNSFLSNCCGLKEVDFSPLVHVKEVEFGFMRNCTSLTHVDVAPFHALQVIPHLFLAGCSGLTAIDLTPLVKVNKVSQSAFRSCTNLARIALPPQISAELLPAGVRGIAMRCVAAEEEEG